MNDIYDMLKESSKPETKTIEENKPYDKTSWSEKKRIEKDRAYEMIANTVSEISCSSEKLQAYLDIQSKLDKYSTPNVLLIMAQKPTATQFKDYDGWKETGFSVKPKEKGVVILEPSGEYQRADGTTATSYNTKKVFDISQTFAKENIKPQINHDERLVLKALIKDSPVPINAVDSLEVSTMGAIYDDKNKTVFVCRGLENSRFFIVVSQELAYADFAKDGNNNRSDNKFKAFCVSYMLCKKYGIDTKSFEFKDLHENFKNQDNGGVKNTLSSIRKTMNEINDRLSKSFDKSKDVKQNDYQR
jgi:hypothetical protein